jgi:serine phosphatase RsbU (regulator of sigma subunit)/tetratricopeptide (TPR) repeat protein
MQQFSLKVIILIVLIFPHLGVSVLSAQSTVNTDSVKQLLKEKIAQEEPDSIIDALFIKTFNEHKNNEWGVAVNIAKQATAYFKTSKSGYCQAWYNRLGFLYLKHDIYQLALNTYYEGIRNCTKQNKSQSQFYLNLARVYLARDLNLNKAEQLLIQAIDEYKNDKSGDKDLKQLAYAYNQLGIVYERQKKYIKALNFFNKSLNTRYKTNDTEGLLNSLYSIAYFYQTTHEYDSAIIYFNKAIRKDFNKTYRISILINRALVYAYKSNFQSAYSDINSALEIANTKSKFDLGRVYKQQSLIYQIENNTQQAINSAIQCLNIANKYNLSTIKLEILPLLAEYFEQTGNFRKASSYQKKYIELTKIKNEEKSRIIQSSYADSENALINSLKTDKVKLKEKNKLLYFIVLISVLAVISLTILFVFLFRNRKKLSKFNKETRVYAVIAKILENITNEQASLEAFLQDSLEEILNIPWFKFEAKGSIFLTNKDGNLKMVAHKNLDEPLLKKCDIVKPGECLCGKALQQKSILYCNHIGKEHEFKPGAMKDHGHYNIPIMFHGDVLGILNLYIAAGHKKQEYEVDFLTTICKTLASVINRKTVQLELQEKAKDQEQLNQKLFAQTLEVEQRNIEIQQHTKEQEKLNQKLFAQKLEVEQRNSEVERISQEQEKLNQKLFAQKMEVEQRNIEIEKYAKEQDKLNQKFFAQTLELDQRNIEIKRYSDEIEKQKTIVELTHKDLTDSISYAQTIQEALLPTDEQIQSLLNDYFVIYNPRDVVSGDFYYAAKVGKNIIFSVADCTGHGVPGGFLTMLGISYLNDIIKRQEVNTPAEALELLRVNIKGVFEREGEINHNGLDIALCAINESTNTLLFSGAYSSLFILRNNELTEYKATKNPIGWHPKEIPFKDYTIKLQDNDLIYLFSDGYHDQFGLNNRKFLKKRFKLLLQEIKDMPMAEQKNVLEGIFKKWQGDNPQTDDVTVMAIRWHQ